MSLEPKILKIYIKPFKFVLFMILDEKNHKPLDINISENFDVFIYTSYIINSRNWLKSSWKLKELMRKHTTNGKIRQKYKYEENNQKPLKSLLK